MRWFRGVRDGAALVRLATKKKSLPVEPAVFFLDPYYAKTSAPPALKFETVSSQSPGGLGCGLLLLAGILAGAWWLFQDVPGNTGNPNDMGLAAVFLGFVSLLLVVSLIMGVFEYVQGRRRYARLTAAGILLPGKVVDVDFKLAGKRFRRIITYEFSAPGGQILQGKQSRSTPPIMGELPAPGTPVQILYADAQTYVML